MFSTEDYMARRQLEREMIDEGTAVWRQKKEMDAVREHEERKQLRMMLKSYNPWGKPGNGAPNPGSLRKSKLILDAPNTPDNPDSVLSLGRPGNGAPLRSSSGRQKATVRNDPSIRFQFLESSRRSVDNELRYRSTAEEKENYRRQLDALINQKIQLRKGQHVSTPSGLERSKQGWSNEATLRRFPRQEAEQIFEISGGVELVPLLAKNRVSPRRPLPTTDITRISRIQNGPPKTPHTEAMYHHELSSQVSQRQQKLQEARQDDLESSQRHFDTWKTLWGRPGHGAPKGCNLAKEKLDVILYHIPARRLSAM